VVHALRALPGLDTRVCVTAQHRGLSIRCWRSPGSCRTSIST
jgi:hypothetical protein